MVNYEYISKVLCENKAKPELKCNGKCHLMKELAKSSEEEKPSSSDKKVANYPLEVLFCQEIITINFSKIHFFNISVAKWYSNLYSHLSSHSFFHPPTF